MLERVLRFLLPPVAGGCGGCSGCVVVAVGVGVASAAGVPGSGSSNITFNVVPVGGPLATVGCPDTGGCVTVSAIWFISGSTFTPAASAATFLLLLQFYPY